MKTIQHLWDENHAPVELEDVFLHFWNKFRALATPRSVAEARVTQPEIEFLLRWFSGLYGKPRNWCEREWQEELTDGVSVSPQEMFGSLFLILACEVCRDQCGEDALWPSVAGVLRADKITYPLLFSGGQPTAMTKSAIAAGARCLGLRNLIDRHGAQEYFDTLKLQFGFTRKGALGHLPEWLDGISTPIAVRILRGEESDYSDLRSESFGQMWGRLVDLRRGRVSATSLSSELEQISWLRSPWIPQVLSVVERKAVRSLHSHEDSPGDSSEPMCTPLLEWQTSTNPRLFLQLNQDRIVGLLGDADSAAFVVDGRIVARWIADGGSWMGPRTIPCDPGATSGRPNFSPKILSISSGAGIPIADIDLTELGFSEPFLVFDLEKGSVVPSSARFDPSKDYVVVCDNDFKLTGCYPFPGKNRSIYKLTSPWNPEVELLCNDVLHWKPRVNDAAAVPQLRLMLTNPRDEIVNIGSNSKIVLKNVPDDVNLAYLLIGGREYKAEQTESIWETKESVPITVRMALGDERLRVRLGQARSMRSTSPRMSMRLNGLAIIDTHSEDDPHREWSLLNGKRPLNIGGGSSRVRIFSEDRRPYVYEGPRFVRRLDTNRLSLRDLWGWGWPLVLRSSNGSVGTIVDSVQDRGSVSIYLGTLLGKSVDRLHLRIPIEPGRDHSVIAWTRVDSAPLQISSDRIQPDRDNYVWKLPSLGPVVAVALAYKGVCLGSQVKTDSILDTLVRAPTARLFSLIRWLKLPVVADALHESMNKAVIGSPIEFVRGWIGKEKPAGALTHRQSDLSVESILRWFLWNYTENSEARLDGIASELSGESTRKDGNEFVNGLRALCDLCPGIAYKFAKSKVRGSKYWQYAKRVVALHLRQPEHATLSELRGRMAEVSRQCSEASRIAPEQLRADMELLQTCLDSRRNAESEAESRTRRVAELSIGRQYLSTSLILRLLGQSNP